MATLDTLLADFNQFKTDMTTALARAQADLDKLSQVGTLTPEQQAIVDQVDQGLTTADSTLQAFDVPKTPPTP